VFRMGSISALEKKLCASSPKNTVSIFKHGAGWSFSTAVPVKLLVKRIDHGFDKDRIGEQRIYKQLHGHTDLHKKDYQAYVLPWSPLCFTSTTVTFQIKEYHGFIPDSTSTFLLSSR
jgi:hypothetical protein